ncbi:hypothetical protein J1N35_035537 [Gossypium stocksii]|uniref:RNase H type-1 domain-containing protein n=1 Tax=Gossypium stocksii TaxID=47602 RepID=A0A9D3ZRK5_9ROSI|nr:hypothetical protein J1N35_035537 [Gossypium stocksii]
MSQEMKIVAFIKAYSAEISVLGECSNYVNRVNETKWEPPDDSIIKINFEASFNQQMKRSVSGIVARNKEGLVMAACTFPWEIVPDPVTAKARACLQALIMAEEVGFRDICVEGDPLSVIRKVNSLEEDRSNISSLIKEINGRSPKFRRLSFRHIPREANRAAHEMAVEGGRHVDPEYWIEEVPQAVERLVNQDRR